MISKRYNEQMGNYLAKLAQAQTDISASARPTTNADRLRSMTDEELAEFLSSTDGDFPPNCENVPIRKLEEYWLDWLRQEVNNGN